MLNAFLMMLLFIQPMIHDQDLSITHDDQLIQHINRNHFLENEMLKPFIDQGKIRQLILQVEKEVHQQARNAKITPEGNIKPEKVGYQLNREKFTEGLFNYLFGSGSYKMEVPEHTVHPKVDSELLANIRTQEIGSYITYFNPNNKERSHNIKLAAEAIDSHVVFPGETFSFNEVVGKRTKEKGYKPAPVIVKGEVTEGIGGGICQISSTMYNAVDNAGVKILERYSHSKRVPYVPEGRDATVSWYGPDFTFKNVYNQPLLIRTKVTNGQVSITVYSSDVVDFESRKIPGSTKKLPEEIELDSQD
ncbi:Putative peptidoglycan binding domain-containing protein [Thalassobacillus cyri]|uniref:Putative peptidoglycan binding domain-containing protein n=1 Tax=Thalassobacillus cyri TaxID=571932 RepID=A0A1H3ZEM9_9BACI|nr:VanW family protein [Thalassobacillus cyri]SEA22196.1 Putative peptidoglycan binding domain-containing protein [Thalassobacillus cyri]